MSRLGSLGNRLYTGEVTVDFVGRKRLWFIGSALIILASLAALFFLQMKFSIDFRGGVDYSSPVAEADQPASSKVTDVRRAVIDTGKLEPGTEPVVTSIGDGKINVQTTPLSIDDQTVVKNAIAKEVDVPASKVSSTSIGATWGEQITGKGITSLIVFIGLVMIVIWVYFREWRMSVAAITALLHDLVITVGVYAFVGFEVTPATIIGVLTILGYSLYDTVVVFDKVRENTKGVEQSSRETYSRAANRALNQTLVRSLNTSFIALLPVGGILFVGAGLLGAGTLKDLALALFVGIAAGTFSSVFIATPLLCWLKEREPAMKALRKRVERRAATEAADPEPVSPAPEYGGADFPEPAVTSSVPSRQVSYTTSAGRAQPQRGTRSSRRRRGR